MRSGLLALAAAVFAGLAVSGRPAGLGLTVVAETVLLAGAGAAPRDRWTTAWWWLGAVLAAMPVLRTAGWVVALSLAGSIGLAIAAAARASTWSRLATAPVRWLVGLVPGPLVALTPLARGGTSAVLRGLAVAAVLVAAFGALLAGADSAFADVTARVLPNLSGDPAPRVGLALLVAAVAGALVTVAALPAPAPDLTPAPRVGRTEARIALGALAALFAAFVTVQAATLFGGDAFVRETAHLTYAQYARSGFALLLVVAALTLAVVAAAAHWSAVDRWLLAVLSALTLVILASAWHRLGLYTGAYGATRAREFAGWSIVWLAGLLALTVAGRAAPRAVVTWAAVLGVAFGLANPDARVASGATDPAYRASLSDDAAAVTGRCVDRGGGVLSLTLPAVRDGCP